MSRFPIRARVTLGALALLAVPAGADVDPFYLSRLREAEVSLARGDARGAVRDLRIACFGMLREPNQLGGCLATLVLAEVRSGDTDAAMRSFGRLVEAETLVGAWSGAELPASTRDAFVREVGLALPEAQLADRPAFAELVDAKRAAALAGLSGNAKRRALRDRIASQPTVRLWAEELVRHELAENRPEPALAEVDRARDRGLDSETLRCLAGAAAHQLRRWARVAEELVGCPPGRRGLEHVEALLELGREDDARARWHQLPAELRESARGQILESRLGPMGSNGTSAPPPRTAEPVADAPTLSALRAALTSARDAAAMRAVLEQAEAIANRDGTADSWHLAAEAAYRLSLWQRAAELYDRGGRPSVADQQFYYAVALFEVGRRDEARAVLALALPQLRRTEYVERMIERISN